MRSSKAQQEVEQVNNIKFLDIYSTADLTWALNTSHLVKKTEQKAIFPEESQAGQAFLLAAGKLQSLSQYDSLTWQLHKNRTGRTWPE